MANHAEAVRNNLARNLKHIRLVKGLTQNQVAAVIHSSRKYYGDIEQGKAYPDVMTLCMLADYYDVDLMKLITIDCDKMYKEIYSVNGRD